MSLQRSMARYRTLKQIKAFSVRSSRRYRKRLVVKTKAFWRNPALSRQGQPAVPQHAYNREPASQTTVHSYILTDVVKARLRVHYISVLERCPRTTSSLGSKWTAHAHRITHPPVPCPEHPRRFRSGTLAQHDSSYLRPV
ncbi:Piso0_001088 [Millerozyma farinosa CBS 7064]|uniref:Piso0_001088 protein n=1 Tax=Pichia sorbitophila (strain ATCC MYA-4447 / BCRC 22081 / CBS 7064 / NBRC 10061 / NRRL Y-12695) TaxID=559304 RepID=G8YQW6_PICSO|nr:Piso0_001088 [Millerozyma farinosa CBS 7064]CCE79051.1 Piso0_001088 [Millerozyma farinosa CBS 7064]